MGTARGLETKIIPREGFNLELIEVAALKRVSIVKRVKSLLMLPKSFLAVRSLIKQVRPDVVIGVGGYASGPVVLMAALMKVPTLVAEQNAMPGFTNRVLARFVKAAAVSFEEARRFFGEKAEITGNPVRAEFLTFQSNMPKGIQTGWFTCSSPAAARARARSTGGGRRAASACGRERPSVVHPSNRRERFLPRARRF